MLLELAGCYSIQMPRKQSARDFYQFETPREYCETSAMVLIRTPVSVVAPGKGAVAADLVSDFFEQLQAFSTEVLPLLGGKKEA